MDYETMTGIADRIRAKAQVGMPEMNDELPDEEGLRLMRTFKKAGEE